MPPELGRRPLLIVCLLQADVAVPRNEANTCPGTVPANKFLMEICQKLGHSCLAIVPNIMQMHLPTSYFLVFWLQPNSQSPNKLLTLEGFGRFKTNWTALQRKVAI